MTRTPAPDPLRLGALVHRDSAMPLPLRHTAVTAEVTGPLAAVRVTQQFINPFDTPVELVYLFPLPHEAAVTDFAFAVGARTIRAEIAEREEARAAYEGAVQRGARAGLLNLERPNLFRLELANVAPGEAVEATICYQERLHWEDGHYQFVFPMGITPRYHGASAEAGALDAPVTLDTEAVGPVEIAVLVDAGAPAGDPRSPSHACHVERETDQRFRVTLADRAIPNKDFVLRYPVAGDQIQASAWVSGGAEPVALVTALPPRLEQAGEPGPREFIFVLDRSGSMSGGPMRQALDGVRAALRALGPADTFNLLAFDDQMDWFSRRSAALTQTNVDQADAWLQSIDARGGTEIVTAVREALNLAPDRRRRRYLLFLTDGAVYAEAEALRLIEEQIGGARLFTFGLGPSVNRSLLSGMAELGRGTARFLQLSEDIEAAIIQFADQVSFPVVQDLELAWEGVTAEAVYPASLPDLYVGQPLELVARLGAGSGPGRLTLTGRCGDQAVRVAVALPAVGDAPEVPAVGRAYAAARLGALAASGQAAHASAGEVVRLSKAHRILTPRTAFVAVDSEPPVSQDGRLRRVEVAVPLPEGLEPDGFSGGGPLPPMMAASMPMPSAAPPSMAAPPTGAPARRSKPGLFSRLLGSAPVPPATTYSAPASSERAQETPGSDDPLRHLARTQNVSGSWGAGTTEVESTAQAVLAFVKAGHTTRAGHYRRQLLKAVQWLLATTPADQSGARLRASALRAMAEATGDEPIDHTTGGEPNV